jgi:hypothetical protein
VFVFESALTGDAGREVAAGIAGVMVELLVVGRLRGTRGAVDMVEPELAGATLGLTEASGAPLA